MLDTVWIIYGLIPNYSIWFIIYKVKMLDTVVIVMTDSILLHLFQKLQCKTLNTVNHGCFLTF